MNDTNDFEELTEQKDKGGFLREFYLMLKHNKKWWITPIVIVLLIFGLLIILGGSTYAPFIYTLF
jgi:hypothetical protein